jgi:hypothetical protein
MIRSDIELTSSSFFTQNEEMADLCYLLNPSYIRRVVRAKKLKTCFFMGNMLYNSRFW